jgi:hypothetical protein
LCNILDNTSLYLQILHKLLNDEDIGHGRNGYFLAASGHVAWDDIYSVMAKHMARKKMVTSDLVEGANDAVLERMDQALGCPKNFVSLQLGGEYVDHYTPGAIRAH